MIDSLINTPFGTTVIPPQISIPRSYTATEPAITIPLVHLDGSSSDFIYTVDKNSLYIKNIIEDKGIFIKIGLNGSKKFMMFSNTTNEANKFRAFSYKSTGVKSLNFNTVMKELKLDIKANSDIFAEIFGLIGNTIADKCDYIAGKYKLTLEVGKSFVEEGKPIAGWGMKSE